MIVRVLHEGQFEVSGKLLDDLNVIDNQIVEAVEKQDQKRFTSLMKEMNEMVHKHGKPVPAEEIVESDIILPDPDSSMAEVGDMFGGDGVIPD